MTLLSEPIPFERTELGRSWTEFYRNGAGQFLTSHVDPEPRVIVPRMSPRPRRSLEAAR